MIGVYNGEALKTMKKIMDNVRSYYPNQTYKNNQYNIYWFINSKGYLHVLRPSIEKMNGRIVNYTITYSNRCQYIISNTDNFRHCLYNVLQSPVLSYYPYFDTHINPLNNQ